MRIPPNWLPLFIALLVLFCLYWGSKNDGCWAPFKFPSRVVDSSGFKYVCPDYWWQY